VVHIDLDDFIPGLKYKFLPTVSGVHIDPGHFLPDISPFSLF